MVCIVHGVDGKIIKMAVPMQPAQAAFAHLFLNCEKIIIIKIKCGIKLGLTILAGGKNTISYQYMVMDVGVEITAEAVDKSDCPKSGTSRGSRTALAHCSFHCPQENPKQATDNFRWARIIMATTGHRSERMVRRYIRDGNLFEDCASDGLL